MVFVQDWVDVMAVNKTRMTGVSQAQTASWSTRWSRRIIHLCGRTAWPSHIGVQATISSSLAGNPSKHMYQARHFGTSMSTVKIALQAYLICSRRGTTKAMQQRVLVFAVTLNCWDGYKFGKMLWIRCFPHSTGKRVFLWPAPPCLECESVRRKLSLFVYAM